MAMSEEFKVTEPKEKKKRKSPRKPCASSTGGSGKRDVDQSSWRKKLQTGRIKFDDKAKQVFLESFVRSNLGLVSAKCAGVSYQTVLTHLENDPEFAEAYEEARQAFKDRLVTHAHDLIFDGMKDPIIGGKDRDEVVGYKTTFPIRLIEMELKKVDPAYTDRQSIDLTNNSSGVLVAPATMTPEEWIKDQMAKNADKVEPNSAEAVDE